MPAVLVGRSIPSLDGLRAISIALVVFSHLLAARIVPDSVRSVLQNAVDPGAMGVRIFFVISGFLITTLLLRERADGTAIDLPRFYLRRALRIFPPFYFYLAVVWALSQADLITVAPHHFLHAATFTTNYHIQGMSWYVGHAWSLSIEEQFYLLWPVMLALVNTRRAGVIAGAVVLVGPVIKGVLFAITPPEARRQLAFTFFGVADCLAVGCALAVFRPSLHRCAWYGRLLAARWFWLLLPVVLFGWTAADHRRLALLSQTGAVVGIALCLDRVVTHPAGTVGRLLNWGPVVWIGRLSYSIYLWQQLFTHRDVTDPALHEAGLLQVPVNLLLILGCAAASYYLIELPSLRVRNVIERWDARRRASTSTPTPAT